MITELQTSVGYIAEALAKIEGVLSNLRNVDERDSCGVEMVHSRIHREVPPIIPADLASAVSRTSDTRVQPPVSSHYVNWADNLSRMSTVSRSSRAGDASEKR